MPRPTLAYIHRVKYALIQESLPSGAYHLIGMSLSHGNGEYHHALTYISQSQSVRKLK